MELATCDTCGAAATLHTSEFVGHQHWYCQGCYLDEVRDAQLTRLQNLERECRVLRASLGLTQ